MELIKQSKMEEDPFIHRWGFSLDMRLVDVVGKVLQPPDIIYRDQRGKLGMKVSGVARGEGGDKGPWLLGLRPKPR